MEKLIVIIIAVLFSGYVVGITVKFGILHSISRSYYELEKKGKGFIFTLFLFAVSVLLTLYSAYIPVDGGLWFYFGGVGAAFTGAASMYYERITGIVHYVASGVLLAAPAIGLLVVFNNGWPLGLLSAGLILAFIAYKKDILRDTIIFWYELYAFSLLIINLYLSA